ncbi:hypothetical protein ACMX25_36445 [Caballeronia sp. 15715]|uniref:hypothetical protein n=1 Tax=Caballeronia sp. 15715 TaxID=3391030 RepID=UPI0039E6B898
MANGNYPFYPIIYVRGYAMTEGAIDETAADPFCGYNAGSTIFRAVADTGKNPRRFIFESPVVRLAADYRYGTTYSDGYEISDDDWKPNPITGLPLRCVAILRYYDSAAQVLGGNAAPNIPDAANQLSALILKLRTCILASPDSGVDTADDFRCYLVGHSMGGLVCRAFLQNDPPSGAEDLRRHVDKFFTYATPHNGIDVAGFNVPPWLSKDAANNFNRDFMAQYLNLDAEYKATNRVDWLPVGPLSPRRVFCMVGTNRSDYEAAMGASRTFVGHGSDGLVRIENATLRGIASDNTPGEPCAKAFTYRAHSGYFGIVNGEESYQNLTRFLFGDIRVDIWADIDSFRLPPEVVADANGKNINALYQFELLASPRGKPWYLSRRIAEEDSVACLSYQDWIATAETKSMYLSTVFLSNLAKMDSKDPTLAYSVTLGIRAPDYEVDGVLWMKEHFEGGYLFRKTLIIRLSPAGGGQEASVEYEWLEDPTTPPKILPVPPATEAKPGEISIPFDNPAQPGVTGSIRFAFSPWNVGRSKLK